MSESGQACGVWGVLNVTPDSFSDGGRYLEPDAAAARVHAMVAEGADVIDIGGASSRPPGAAYGTGAKSVSADEEIRRVMPAVEAAVRCGRVRVSIDTTRVQVAERALSAGASIVNDVSCAMDEALLDCASRFGAEYVLMHNRGNGSTVGSLVEYDSVLDDVCRELEAGMARVSDQGVSSSQIWVDPGLGFAKTSEQSMTVLAGTDRLARLGCRVLVGPSRKAFLAEAAPNPDGTLPRPLDRQPGTDAAVALAVALGAAGVRVHNVAAGRQSAMVGRALASLRMGLP